MSLCLVSSCNTVALALVMVYYSFFIALGAFFQNPIANDITKGPPVVSSNTLHID